MNLEVHSPNVETTHALAGALAGQCAAGDCVLLVGELGAGKTTFARGFIHALAGKEEEVVSPTFTLVQHYKARSGLIVWHCDLYRLRRPEEALELGLDEALASGIVLIEWPELIRERLPANALTVRLDYAGDTARAVAFSGGDAAWQARLKMMKGKR